MFSRVMKKSRIIIRRIRSVPWRFIFFLYFPIVIVINLSAWDSTRDSLILFFIIGGISVLLPTILLLPRSLHEYRQKTVSLLLSGHYCPRCGYSLIGLQCCKDGFTSCPKCGLSWKLPERVNQPSLSSDKHHFGIISSWLILIALFVYIIWSIELGGAIFSSRHILALIGMIAVVLDISKRRNTNKNKSPRLVMTNYHKFDGKNCPACNVVLDEARVDWGHGYTCRECGAAWKLTDRVSQP